MTSARLQNALSQGKVVVRKHKSVSGEVVINFSDPVLGPVRITGTAPVVLSDIPGISSAAIQRSNLRKLQAMGVLELVTE